MSYLPEGDHFTVAAPLLSVLVADTEGSYPSTCWELGSAGGSGGVKHPGDQNQRLGSAAEMDRELVD